MYRERGESGWWVKGGGKVSSSSTSIRRRRRKDETYIGKEFRSTSVGCSSIESLLYLFLCTEDQDGFLLERCRSREERSTSHRRSFFVELYEKHDRDSHAGMTDLPGLTKRRTCWSVRAKRKVYAWESLERRGRERGREGRNEVDSLDEDDALP